MLGSSTDGRRNLKVRSNITATCYIQTDPGCELIMELWVERTGLVKFCVFAVFLVNCTPSLNVKDVDTDKV